MATNYQTYIDFQAPLITAAWLNDVGNAVYNAIGSGAVGSQVAPTTPAQVVANLTATPALIAAWNAALGASGTPASTQITNLTANATLVNLWFTQLFTSTAMTQTNATQVLNNTFAALNNSNILAVQGNLVSTQTQAQNLLTLLFSAPGSTTTGIATALQGLFPDTTRNALALGYLLGTPGTTPAAAVTAISNLFGYTGAQQQGINSLFLGATSFPRRNANGDFSVWQRGTTFSPSAATVTYGADQWWTYRPTVGNYTVSQQAGTNSRFSLKLQRNASDAALNPLTLGHTIAFENSSDLANRICTLSFYAKVGANYSGGNLSVIVDTGTAMDQGSAAQVTGGWTGAATPLNTTQALTTALVRYSFQFTLAAGIKEVGFRFAFTPSGTAGADDSVTFEAVQFQYGLLTPFEVRPASAELAVCQRFLIAYNGQTISAMGQATAGGTATVVIPFPATMRGTPTGVTVANAANFNVTTAAGAAQAVTGITLQANGTSPVSGGLAITVASGLAAGNATQFYSGNANTQLIFTGLEL